MFLFVNLAVTFMEFQRERQNHWIVYERTPSRTPTTHIESEQANEVECPLVAQSRHSASAGKADISVISRL